jgi:hypothetical protein
VFIVEWCLHKRTMTMQCCKEVSNFIRLHYLFHGHSPRLISLKRLPVNMTFHY